MVGVVDGRNWERKREERRDELLPHVLPKRATQPFQSAVSIFLITMWHNGPSPPLAPITCLFHEVSIDTGDDPTLYEGLFMPVPLPTALFAQNSDTDAVLPITSH